MPYEISELLPKLPKPVTAEPNEPLMDALSRMLRHGYSQLPVLKGSGQATQFYLLTTQGILEKLQFFGVSLQDKKLRVEDAMGKKITRLFSPEDTITDVMDGLKEQDAILIVNEQRELQNIVTIYDTTHFFRQWSEDLLNARDVEMLLRRIITAAFKRSDGTIDEAARQKAIDGAPSDDNDFTGNSGYKRFADALKTYLSLERREKPIAVDRPKAFAAFKVLLEPSDRVPPAPAANQTHTGATLPQPSNGSETPPSVTSAAGGTPGAVEALRNLRQRFEAAIQVYLESTQTPPEPDSAWLAAAYRQHFQKEAKSFNKLSLGAYIDLFFLDQCWGRCGSVFRFGPDVVRPILTAVRDVRNLLAHFREEEITQEHRRMLQQAAEWLPSYEKEVLAKLDETAPNPPAAPEDLSLIGLAHEPTSQPPH